MSETILKKIAYISVGWIAAFFFVYFLIVAQDIIVPFLLAIFLSYLFIPLVDWMKDKHIPSVLIFLILIFFIFVIGYSLWQIFLLNINNFIEQAPVYQDKMIYLVENTSNYLKEKNIQISFLQILEKINIPSIIESLVAGFSNLFSNIVLIGLYFTYFIVMRKKLHAKFVEIFENILKKKDHFSETLKNISDNIKKYIFYKTLISLAIAIVSWFILVLFGIDFSIIWALIIFFLNYIPNIGTFIALTLPFIFSFIQFENPIVSIILLIILLLVQTFFENFVEPRIYGNKLDLNPIVILLAVIIGGVLWGVSGMIISIPVLSTLSIISKQIPALKILNIILKN